MLLEEPVRFVSGTDGDVEYFDYLGRYEKQAQAPLKILLLKPYQPISALLHSPPLGLLYLAAMLRQRFEAAVDVKIIDMKVNAYSPDWLREQFSSGQLQADIVGVSALNFEASVSKEIAAICKQHKPEMITVLGGPFALHRSEELLHDTEFDWVFSGAADHSFCEIVECLLKEQPFTERHIGFSFKHANGVQVDINQANIKELDTLPMPAWDLVDFDAYAKKTNMMGMLKGKRYATLFTSRGCPYLCNYCHDIFSKKFTYRSAENVLDEIAYLYENYGVDEFQIVDDIFNLHKPRLKAIMNGVKERWPGQLKFTFPNGVRGDILDEDVVQALAEAGTYALKIAVETVTPRLQTLIEKDLDVEKTSQAIEMCNRHGIMTGGFFMLGFPTETEEEIKATIDYALKSKLTVAHFFIVVPQKETPLYELAKQEDSETLQQFTLDQESGNTTYYSSQSWYQRTYGIPLNRHLMLAFIRFYGSPVRIYKMLTLIPAMSLLDSGYKLLGIISRLWSK